MSFSLCWMLIIGGFCLWIIGCLLESLGERMEQKASRDDEEFVYYERESTFEYEPRS